MNVQPVVYRKRRVRRGRGFSREELKALNLTLKKALRLGIPIDPRRRSRHEENIEALRRLLEAKLKGAEPPKGKETEET